MKNLRKRISHNTVLLIIVTITIVNFVEVVNIIGDSGAQAFQIEKR